MTSTILLLLFLATSVLPEDYLAEFDDEIETKRFGSGTPSASSRNYDASISSIDSGSGSYSASSSSTTNTSLAVTKNQPSVANSIDLEPLPTVPKSTVGGCGGDEMVAGRTSFAPGTSPCGGCGASDVQGNCGTNRGCTINSGSCGNPNGCGGGIPSPCARGGCGQPYPPIPYYPQVRNR